MFKYSLVIQIFKLAIAFVTTFSGGLWALALNPINLEALTPLQTESVNAVSLLKSLTDFDKYISCSSDLSQFIANTKPADFNELKKMSDQSRTDKKKLLEILGRGLKGLTKAKPQFDPDLQNAYVLIGHQGFKCQLSIYAELGMDQIKVNVDPTLADQKIAIGKTEVDVESTLIGASFDMESQSLHFDPSKAITL